MRINSKFFDRELSWLSFNYRVLQEAKDKSVPLYERIKFLAIYSNNLDEFFRVRVATLRGILLLKKKSLKQLKFDPKNLLKKIHSIVKIHQIEMGEVFRNEIISGLNENNIFLIDNTQLNKKQSKFVNNYFEENIRHYINEWSY